MSPGRGKTFVIGGTSAVAPLWAGLIAVANQQTARSAGFIQPAIYAARSQGAFRDNLSGNNGSFQAGPGWDACTGLGFAVAPRVISAVEPRASGSTLKIAASRKKAWCERADSPGRSHRKRDNGGVVRLASPPP